MIHLLDRSPLAATADPPPGYSLVGPARPQRRRQETLAAMARRA